MKKILLAIFTFLIALNVYASELSLECPSEVKLNEKVDCKIKVSSLEDVDVIKFSVLEPTDATVTPIWSHVESEGLHTFTKDTNESLTLATLSFTAKTVGNTKVQLSDITGVSGSSSSKEVNVLDIKSENANLKKLTVNGKDVDNFNKDKTEYKITVNTNKVNIEAEAEDSKSQVNVPGSQSLSIGEQTFTITVTSESGKEKSYRLTINYELPKNTDNSLKTLELYNGTTKIKELEYKSGVNTYEGIKVKAAVDKLTIKATLNDSKAKFVDNYGPRDVTLDYGENIFNVRVEAENGSLAEYTIKVEREDGRNSDTTLSKLTVNGNEVELKNGVYEYTVNVRYNETKSVIETLPTSTSSKVDYEDIELVSGENPAIIIKVTSENNKTQEYKIKINRLSEAESKITLQKIEVVNYDIDFDLNKTDYDINLREGDKSLEFVILPTEGIKKNISGNSDLSNKRTVYVKITDDDGLKEYKFHIIAPEEEGTSILLYLIILALLILGAIIAILVIKKKKKKENPKQEVEKKEEIKQEPIQEVVKPTPSIPITGLATDKTEVLNQEEKKEVPEQEIIKKEVTKE